MSTMTRKSTLLKRYYDLRHRIKHWEKYLARNSAGVAKNALKERIRRKVRQAMRARNITVTTLAPQALDHLVILFQKGCVQCSEKDRLELDHVVAVKHGGKAEAFMNFQVLCHDCHKKKTRAEQFRKTLHELEQVRKQLIKEGYTLR
jgi:hypothetical protein